MPEADLALLLRAADEAGEIAMGHFRAGARVWDKPEGAGPVTEADLAVDDHLRESLIAARPGTAWLSEETADTPDRLAASDLFVVDPIDGTRAFIDGSKDWAHSLALVRDGAPVAAVVHLPARGLTYAATAGGGATLNGAAIRVSTPDRLEGARVLANRQSLEPTHWPRGLPGFDRHFRSSLAWRLCLVAEGRFDAMLTLRPAWHWDIAAGALIVAEAGGAVTDRTGRPLPYNTPDARAPSVVAGSTAAHEGLVAALS